MSGEIRGLSAYSRATSALDKFIKLLEGDVRVNNKELSVCSFGRGVRTQDCFSIFNRTRTYKASSNAARLDFLTSVCKVYGFKTDAEYGSRSFKNEVMAFAEGPNLPANVKSQLKLGDYKSFWRGNFKSNRPLTLSRIQKVMRAVAGDVRSAQDKQLSKFTKFLTSFSMNVPRNLTKDPDKVKRLRKHLVENGLTKSDFKVLRDLIADDEAGAKRRTEFLASVNAGLGKGLGVGSPDTLDERIRRNLKGLTRILDPKGSNVTNQKQNVENLLDDADGLLWDAAGNPQKPQVEG